MKQRLLGLVVVLALLAIFMPIISYKMEPKRNPHLSANIPNPPELPKIFLTENGSATKPKGSLANGYVDVAEEALAPASVHPTWAQSTTATAEVFIGSLSSETKAPEIKLAKSHLLQSEKKSVVLEKKQEGEWIIQLGTFSDSKNIHILLGKLSDRKIPAFEQVAVSKGGARMTRIFVGPLLTQHEAVDIKRELQKQLHISGMIKRKSA